MNLTSLPFLLAILVSFRQVALAQDAPCTSLQSQASEIIPGYLSNIYAVQSYPDNTTFQPETPPGGFPGFPVPNLPAFCRFGADFNTSTNTKVRFEVWMPVDGWNGHLAMVGNGALDGAVEYAMMGVPLGKYRFAVVSTDTGHGGNPFDGSFTMNNPETQYDYGYRAVHLSTVFAKNAVRLYYDNNSFKSFFIGCSAGGRQALKEVEMYPEDFDGVVAGAPAQWWSHLQGWRIWLSLINTQSSSGYMNTQTWARIHDQIVTECDTLDGLEDGLITNPWACTVDWNQFDLTEAQIQMATTLFSNYTFDNGNTIFPGFVPGSEYLGVGGFLLPYAADYFKYQVLNFTSITYTYEFKLSQVQSLIAEADTHNPGLWNVMHHDISPFIRHGGKLITYAGTADYLIPPGNMVAYYENVRQAVGYDPRDNFRFFTVPGMGHCQGGYSGAYNFGGAFQNDASQGGTQQTKSFDSQHDMTLALIDWVTKGTAPNSIIAAKFVNDRFSGDLEMERLICPYPLFPQYIGGNANVSTSFSCAS